MCKQCYTNNNNSKISYNIVHNLICSAAQSPLIHFLFEYQYMKHFFSRILIQYFNPGIECAFTKLELKLHSSLYISIQ